jgi:ATP phosphoribosyltransferase
VESHSSYKSPGTKPAEIAAAQIVFSSADGGHLIAWFSLAFGNTSGPLCRLSQESLQTYYFIHTSPARNGSRQLVRPSSTQAAAFAQPAAAMERPGLNEDGTMPRRFSRALPTLTNLVGSLNDRLLFAVPKKGRLNQACIELLSGSDIQFHRHNRLDIALVKNLPLALVFLPASDIPTFVGEGRVDLGITGRDVVAEHEAITPASETSGIQELMDLEFGRCKLQVQVPEKGNLHTPESLVGKTLVTSFTGLSEQYFREMEKKVSNGESNGEGSDKLKTTIKFVGGSVEAACALGVADGIVDLVGKFP